MSSQDAHLALCTAHCARGVLLVETLRSADVDDPSPTRTAPTTPTRCSRRGLCRRCPQDAAPLTARCRRRRGLAARGARIGALAPQLQGRTAVREAASAGVLAGLLADGADAVREAASSALLALSQSRDGCSTLMEHDGIVDGLVAALGDDAAGAPALGCRRRSPTSAPRPRRRAALDAGLMAILCAVVGAKASILQLYPRCRPSGTSPTPTARWRRSTAALSHCVARRARRRRRAPAGGLYAITVDKQGKFEALTASRPLRPRALARGRR